MTEHEISNDKRHASPASVGNVVPGDWDLGALHISVPVSVVLRRYEVRGKFWSLPAWSLDSVLVGQKISFLDQEANPVLLATDAVGAEPSTEPDESSRESERLLWRGYCVNLHRDACERYWHALIGEKPLVYVVLDKDEVDDSVEPALVTIDYDEAVAHSEIDADVLTAAIPGELYRLMEQYVLTHYRPTEFKKRKRKNWNDQGGQGAGDQLSGERLDPWDDRRRFRRPGYHGDS